MLLVLLTVGSLAAGKSFFVVFIPSFSTGLENLDVLCTISFLLGQDSLSVLCIIFFVVGLFTDNLLVIFRLLIVATHLVWRLTNNDLNSRITNSYRSHMANSVYHTKTYTSPSATSSSPSSSGSNFFFISLFNRNFRFATADSAASSKSMSSSSIKRRRVFMTLRCIALCLIW